MKANLWVTIALLRLNSSGKVPTAAPAAPSRACCPDCMSVRSLCFYQSSQHLLQGPRMLPKKIKQKIYITRWRNFVRNISNFSLRFSVLNALCILFLGKTKTNLPLTIISLTAQNRSLSLTVSVFERINSSW